MNNFLVFFLVLLISKVELLPLNHTKTLNKIAFGSCQGLFGAKNNIFLSISDYSPDL